MRAKAELSFWKLSWNIPNDLFDILSFLPEFYGNKGKMLNSIVKAEASKRGQRNFAKNFMVI